MPYCPVCKYEYRPGIKRCPDCKVSLVDELVEEKPKLIEEELVCAASYPFEAPAQTALLQLESQGIQAVLQNEVISQTDLVLAWADGGVKVMVRKSDAKKAREILESGDS